MSVEINRLNTQKTQPAKKGVLFIITQSEIGGAQRFMLNFVASLDRDKYRILVATGLDGGGELNERLQAQGIDNCTLKSLRRNTNFFQDLSAVFEIKSLIKSFKPDTLFLNSSKAGFIGSLSTRFLIGKRPRVVYRIGGWTFNDPWKNWVKKLWIMLEKISSHWKDVIIVNGTGDMEQAKKLGIVPKDKIVVVYNGIDPYKLNFFDKEEARVKIFERISKTWGQVFHAKRIVGTISHLYPAKGCQYLIETAEDFKNDKDIIFCDIGEGAERPKLEELVKEKGLSKKIFFIGALPEAHKFLTAFDIFVLSSVKEGLPWALIEAMSAKLPVIATSVGAVPEVIENGKNGFLIEPRKPKQMTEKIREIFQNERLSQELGIQAHQTVLFKFGADKMKEKIEEVL